MTRRSMRCLGALLMIALALLLSLPASATAGGAVVVGPRVPHRPGLRLRPPRVSNFIPGTVVVPEPETIVVPVPVPVPVAAMPPPPPVDAIPPPSSDEVGSRPIVANPGPKIIDVAPRAPGTKTATVVVQRGSTTVVETVPLQ